MNNVTKYIVNIFEDKKFQHECEDVIREEYFNIIAEDMLNESFQSSIVKNLAKRVWDAESKRREYDKQSMERYKAGKTYYKPQKTEKTFASIFGPKIGNYDVCGIKWDEIKDSDFVKYSYKDKAFKKLLKDMYSHTQNANLICCAKDTNNIELVVKGFVGNNNDIIVYYFEEDSSYMYSSGIRRKVMPKYSTTRNLKQYETMNLIKNNEYDIYALIVTDAMIKKYNDLRSERIESQKGVIKYDKKSLEELAKMQKARYKSIIKDMQTKKLRSNDEQIFSDIKQFNLDAVALQEKIMGNPEYIDKLYSLGSMMNYCCNAYEYYYKYVKRLRNADNYEQKNSSAAHIETEYANRYLRDAKEYLDAAKKEYDELIKQINGTTNP